MNKGMVAALMIISLLVGAFGGFYYEKTRATTNVNAIKLAMQRQIDRAKILAHPTAVAQQNPIMMAKDGYAIDTKGMTLYTYDKDTTSDSTCTDTCTKVWPPYLVSGEAPSTLPMHVGTTKRTDGSLQYTWDNHPLYYYSKDTKVGDTIGDNIGSVWHLAK